MTRVLVAPLDWGLGHAARCVPVVQELQRQGCDVLLAGSGDSLDLLQKEFPGLPAFHLPGYHPRYSSRDSMLIAMARQVPRFMHVIAAEHEAVEKLIAREKVDRLISDNRYGCWSERVPAAFITHQRNILMPNGFGWLQPFVRLLSAHMIRHFDVCWVPDSPGEHTLAGELAFSGRCASTVRTEHVGWLSRFHVQPNTSGKCDVLAIFSGPEPQRTLFENKVVSQLRASGLKFRVVRGLPGNAAPSGDPRIVHFLSTPALQDEIASADVVIARSGYSTVMDMQATGKKVVFVPTPGQTEQEYLARTLTEKGIAFHVTQDSFDLATALARAREFPGFPPAPVNTLLGDAVARFLTDVRVSAGFEK